MSEAQPEKAKSTPKKPEIEVNALDKEEEKILKEFNFYHGFLPREDLLFMLKNEGDYLLRVSEVGSGEKTLTFMDESAHRRAIVLSIVTELPPGDVTVSVMGTANPQLKLKNVIIRRLSSKYFVEMNKTFDTLKELFEYYQKNPGYLNRAKFTLKTPITQQRWEFSHSDVHVGKLIGEGEYGEVREGYIRRKQQTLQVAIKLTKGTGDMSKAKIKEMMREARLIRNFKHRNIVRLYGVAVDEQPLYILFELIKGGSLNVYLRTHRDSVSTFERMSMCRGAALGIEYIHKQSCIHMDLAARNCLYSEEKVVKISDFGLSRLGIQYTIRTARKLPIKWLAPETITTFTFSLKTDVFSYGVMVFEIFTGGKEPWDGFSNAEVKKGLVEGKVLTIPDLCPEPFRTFVYERVFIKDPTSRANMTEVCSFINSMPLDQLSGSPPKWTLSEKMECEKSVYERFVSESPPKSKYDRHTSAETQRDASEAPDKVRFKKTRGFHKHHCCKWLETMHTAEQTTK
ncbi:SH2 domain protein [Dictyocaulus viviparus]|uniref:Tyrosine-protein kinase n=1 Tax=Dictyocaulus viviparus TaxID=29172 RepID=A0A0D8XMW2_DICVI|nr:SH2 domain protein [Dictyocaulus viviparus]